MIPCFLDPPWWSCFSLEFSWPGICPPLSWMAPCELLQHTPRPGEDGVGLLLLLTPRFCFNGLGQKNTSILPAFKCESAKGFDGIGFRNICNFLKMYLFIFNTIKHRSVCVTRHRLAHQRCIGLMDVSKISGIYKYLFMCSCFVHG